jgi:hypothetical protein
MGIEVVTGRIGEDREDEIVLLYYSNEGRALGPRFVDAEEAEEFLGWCPVDLRRAEHSEIVDQLLRFRVEREQRLNAEHEAEGGKFGLQSQGATSTVTGFLIGWSDEGPLKFGWRNEALSFSTYAAAEAMRNASTVLRSARVVRL